MCIDGVSCRCDPAWEGDTCALLRCTGPEDGCNDHGDCENDKAPAPCSVDSNGTVIDSAEGLCTNLLDDCIAAYHECPQRGVSIQVDSGGIVIAEEVKHNQIVYARCICRDAWSGNDCTMPPLPPPPIQPWPDPYEEVDAAAAAEAALQATSAASGRRGGAAWHGGAAAAAAVAALTSAVAVASTRRHARR